MEQTTRFTVAEQVAAIEVHLAMTQSSAVLDQRLGMDEKMRQQLIELKKKGATMPMNMDFDENVKRGLCKAAPV